MMYCTIRYFTNFYVRTSFFELFPTFTQFHKKVMLWTILHCLYYSEYTGILSHFTVYFWLLLAVAGFFLFTFFVYVLQKLRISVL